MVATTLKSPVATRSISASISCSDEEGELRIAYVEWGAVVEGPDVLGAPGVVTGALCGGGRSENSEDDGAMKDRYWSRTYTKLCDLCTYPYPDITHLLYQVASAITRNCGSKLLQQRSRQRLHEIEMERLVEILLEIISYALDVRKCWRYKVYGGYIR